ncbi:MAG: extracellular solute-binding protein [Lachnospiraceae bacterium]|nr:extracellular solute-binding protein [Lachnospiraceae bacterium]
MTTIFQRILSLLIVLLLGMQMVTVGMKSQSEEMEVVAERPLLIWYTDPDIQLYMEGTASEVSAKYGIEVSAELVSEVDYIENISRESVKEQMTGPDIYVTSSALLEKAALAGLVKTRDSEGMAENYSEKAVQAVTYDEKVTANPFYIETCFLVYNSNYVTEEQIPDTIEDILVYAENFETGEGTENVESIFKWNVADVIASYMFLGAYTDLGGVHGDDKSQVSMDLDQIEECMNYYQSLNAFFAIDADTVTSEEVVQEFVDGKIVFTIMNVPMLSELDRRSEGEVPYKVMTLPDLTEELASRGLSVTNSVVVNPYSTNVETAKVCARYLTEDRVDQLYEVTGKLPAYTNFPGEPDEAYRVIYEAYEQSAEVPKIMELSNMWLQLEVVLADIWRGDSPADKLQEFHELLKEQLD